LIFPDSGLGIPSELFNSSSVKSFPFTELDLSILRKSAWIGFKDDSQGDNSPSNENNRNCFVHIYRCFYRLCEYEIYMQLQVEIWRIRFYLDGKMRETLFNRRIRSAIIYVIVIIVMINMMVL
jgi:hypothetical protein